jgi:hypothetical protein
MLLKTHEEKMSVLATPTMFMITSDLSRESHDIDENKGSCALKQVCSKQRRREKEGSRLIFRESKPGLPSVRANEVISPGGINAGGSAIPALAHLRQASKKKIYYVRSRNVYENKGTQDTMPE